jgi:hypothetical protein
MTLQAPEALNDALLAVWGEFVTVSVGAVDTVLTGAFRAPFVGMAVGGLQVERPDPTVTFKTSDLTPVGAQPGDTVTIGAETWQIVSIKPGDGGMTELLLRAFS